VEGNSTQLSFKVASGKSIDIDHDNRDTKLIKVTMTSHFGGSFIFSGNQPYRGCNG